MINIIYLKRGEIYINIYGFPKLFGDCKVTEYGVNKWDWKKTGTHHVPGIQISDLEDMMKFVDHFILTTGMEDRLKIGDVTLKYLRENGKTWEILNTNKLQHRFNYLMNNKKRDIGRIGVLIHTTC